MIQPKKPNNGLTPEDNKKLIEGMTQYANEGATDDELREFRNTFISAKKKSTPSSVSGSTAAPQKSDSVPADGSLDLLGPKDPLAPVQVFTQTAKTQKPTTKTKPVLPSSQLPEGSMAWTQARLLETDPEYGRDYERFKQAEILPEGRERQIRQEVEDEVNNVGFMNKARTLFATGASMLPSFMGGTSGKDIDPLYKEKEQAKKELIQQNALFKKNKQPQIPVTEQEIADRAKEIRINKRIQSERDSQVNSFLTDLENTTYGEGKPNARQRLEVFQIGNQSTLQEKDKQILKKQNVLRPAIESSYSILKDIQKDADNYVKNNQPIPEDLKQQHSIALDAYKNQLKDAIKLQEEYVSNKKDLGDAIENLDTFKRDFSWGKNFENNVLATTMDLAGGLVGFGDYINTVAPGLSPNSASNAAQFRSLSKRFNKEAQQTRDEVMKPIAVDDINSMEDFGKWMANTAVASQIPVYLATATGLGGVGVLGASATGSKFEEMQSEIQAGDADYSAAQLAGIPLAFGATETASALVDRMLLKNAARVISSTTIPERKLVADGFWSQLKNGSAKIGGETIKGALIEGADEAGTQIAQNLLDIYAGDKKNIDVFDGVKDAGAAGAVMGAFIPFGANIVSRMAKPFSTDKSLQQASAELLTLENQLKNPELSPETRDILEKQVKITEEKQQALLKKTVKNVSSLSDKQFQEVVSIEKQQASLKEQRDLVKNNPELSDASKKITLDNLKDQFDKSEQKRLNILEGKTDDSNINVSDTGADQDISVSDDTTDTTVPIVEETVTAETDETTQQTTEQAPQPQTTQETQITEVDETIPASDIADDGGIRPGTGELGAMGEETGATTEVVSEESTQPGNVVGEGEGVAEVDPRVQEIESQRQAELTELQNNPEAIEQDGEFYINGPDGVENSTALINEKYDAEIANLPAQETVVEEEVVERPRNFERKPGKKSVVNRLYQGDTSETVRNVAESLGLTYEVESQEEAQKSAKSFVDKVGITGALDAARTGVVKGAEKAFVYAEVLEKIDEAIENTDPLEQEGLLDQRTAVLSEATNLFDQEARESGRFISALNRIYNTSKIKYSLENQVNSYKAFNKGEIDDATLAKFKEADKHIKELEKQIDDAIKRAEEAEAKLAMQNIVDEVTRAEKTKKSASSQAKKLANQIRKVKVTRPDAFNAATAGIVWDAAIEIVAKTIEAGGTLADAVQAGVNHIKKSKWYRGLSEEKKSNAISQFEGALSQSQTKNNDVVRVEDGAIYIPNSAIRTLVEMGTRDIDELSQKILDMVSEEHPEISLRDVRDAITKYGRTINPTKDAIQKEINLMKRLGRLISGLEDVEEGNRPLRTGLQREKPTQQERQMQRELREKMKDLPLDHAELDKQWKNTLDTIKSRLTNQIEDLEKQIKEGEKRKPERTPVEYDAEANALREKRDELRNILDEMTGKPELTEEQRVQRAINQVEKSIEKIRKQIESNDIGFNPRPKTLSSNELDALKEVRKNLSNELTKMREDAGIVEQRKLDQAKDRVQKRINELQEKIRNNDFAKKEPKPVKEDEELRKLRAEKIKWQEVYDREIYQLELKNRTPRQKAREAVIGALNIFRILKATGELSPVFIQGGIQTVNMAVRHPKQLAKAFQKLFVALGSARKADEYDSLMKSDPNYDIMKASKLALVEPDYKLELREEIFIGNYINNIWNLLGKGLENISGKILGVTETMPPGDKIISLFKEEYKDMPKKSISEQFKNVNPLLALERGLTVYMNELRMDRFNDGIKMLEMEGKNIKDNKVDYEKVAAAINTLTGRANIGRLAQVSDILGTIFFSFRNTVSIFNQLNPYWYATLKSPNDPWYKPSIAQKMAVYDMIRFVTITTSAMYLLQAAAGDDEEGNPNIEIETDPRSSDFLKMKQGNIRFDAFHGMIPMIVFFCRQITGETKTSSGDVKDLGTGMFTPTRADLLINMGANKLSPQAGIAYRFANTKFKKKAATLEEIKKPGYKPEFERVSKYGDPYNAADELSVTPIYIESLKEIVKEDPDAVGRFLAFMGVFGINSQVYDSKGKEKIKTNKATD